MKSIFVHGALLGTALLVAFLTWTEDRSTGAAEEPGVTVWQHDPEDVAGVTYRSDERVVELEHRGPAGGRYLWARETTPVPPTSAPDTLPGEPAAPGTRTNVEEYPVGEAGTALVEGLARLRAVRDLGVADDASRARYGLTEPGPDIVVRLQGGEERKISLGKNVVGGGDRYVHDLGRNRVYVLPLGLIRPLQSRDLLRLSRYQTFDPDDVASARVQARGADRTMARRILPAPSRVVWTPADSDRPDDGFANFIEQLDRLWVSRYVTDLPSDKLDAIVRVDYFNSRGTAIGFLELMREPGPETPTYFMRTGRTIVFGEVFAPQAERVEQDVAALFRSTPAAEASAVTR